MSATSKVRDAAFAWFSNKSVLETAKDPLFAKIALPLVALLPLNLA